MNTRKLVKYALYYSVGVYLVQRMTGKQFGLPMVLDPIGATLGYPASVTPAATTAALASSTAAVPAVITAATSPLTS